MVAEKSAAFVGSTASQSVQRTSEKWKTPITRSFDVCLFSTRKTLWQFIYAKEKCSLSLQHVHRVSCFFLKKMLFFFWLANAKCVFDQPVWILCAKIMLACFEWTNVNKLTWLLKMSIRHPLKCFSEIFYKVFPKMFGECAHVFFCCISVVTISLVIIIVNVCACVCLVKALVTPNFQRPLLYYLVLVVRYWFDFHFFSEQE